MDLGSGRRSVKGGSESVSDASPPSPGLHDFNSFENHGALPRDSSSVMDGGMEEVRGAPPSVVLGSAVRSSREDIVVECRTEGLMGSIRTR